MLAPTPDPAPVVHVYITFLYMQIHDDCLSSLGGLFRAYTASAECIGHSETACFRPFADGLRMALFSADGSDMIYMRIQALASPSFSPWRNGVKGIAIAGWSSMEGTQPAARNHEGRLHGDNHFQVE